MDLKVSLEDLDVLRAELEKYLIDKPEYKKLTMEEFYTKKTTIEYNEISNKLKVRGE